MTLVMVCLVACVCVCVCKKTKLIFDASTGDDMILVLKKIIPHDYVLSRQSGSYNRQTFSDLRKDVRVEGMPDPIDLEERRMQGKFSFKKQFLKNIL